MKTKTYTSTLTATLGLIFLNILMAAMGLILLNGCQQEVTEIIQPSTDEAFTSGSTLTGLIARTSMNDGKADDIVDGSSCSEMVLPVTIQIKGIEIILDSREDFKTVERILDELDDDNDDKIIITFPIKVVLADYSELILYDDDDLDDLMEQCNEGSFDDDIECIDFKYPLSISIYDSKNQLSDVLTFNDNKSLYRFIDNLDDDDYASFNFPITLLQSDGTELLINNYDHLEDMLEDAIDDCEDDDLDEVDNNDFVAILTEGNWKITNNMEDDKDETARYNGYVFTFYTNGIVTAEKDGVTLQGSWETEGEDSTLELELDFPDDSPLDELDEEWDVWEFDGSIIRLKDDGDYLTFERP